MLKAEAINQAYSAIRISGLTTQEVPEEVVVALRELDQLMAIWRGMGREINYNFPPPTSGNELVQSDPGDTLGVYDWAVSGVISSLAKTLVMHFGKPVPPELASMSRFAVNVIKQRTFKAVEQQYPNRMPLGSGNLRRNLGYIARFYYPNYRGRGDQEVIKVTQNLDLTSDFTNDLKDGDTIASYVIVAEPTGGVSLISDSQDGNVINYRVVADKERDGNIRITVTTTNGLIIPKAYCFATVDNSCVMTNG